MGIIVAGNEMAVPSSVQVGLKIVIFKEKKTGTQRSGQIQSLGTDRGRCSDVRLRAPLAAQPNSPITPFPKPRQNTPPHLP